MLSGQGRLCISLNDTSQYVISLSEDLGQCVIMFSSQGQYVIMTSSQGQSLSVQSQFTRCHAQRPSSMHLAECLAVKLSGQDK